jgi:putative membrane protein
LTRAERVAAVHRRGFEAFHTLHVRATKSGTGVLLYVSLFERLVWVCPDDAIAARLGPEVWQPVSDLVARGFRSGNPGVALAEAVRTAGEILVSNFPRTSPNENELPDSVRILDDTKNA